MKVFKIATRDYDFIVLADTKDEAKIKFSSVNPSLRIREINETQECIFMIN